MNQSQHLYQELQQNLAQGWNTWDTRSVLTHVHLPSGLALRLGIKEYRDGGHLREALIGRLGDDAETVVPGVRAWDGAYTSLKVTWRGVEIEVQTARDGDDWLCLVTPLSRERQLKTPLLIVEGGFLWNSPGSVLHDGAGLKATSPNGGEWRVGSSTAPVEEPQTSALGPYLAIPLDTPVALFTGKERSLEEVGALMAQQRSAVEHDGSDQAELRSAIQTCMAWDTIYDPAKQRVISPVSRIWSSRQGGWVLFCWDTFFAASLAATGSKELAYANVIEILREKTPDGFVPNVSNAHGFKSLDRSQPPVGSITLWELFQQFGDRWLLELAFDDLLVWNRWWLNNRVVDGLLAWGSDHYEAQTGHEWEYARRGVGERFGASLESGLDNSPMYDDIPYDEGNHCLMLQDAGLSALYVADCESLAAIARELGRPEADELAARAEDVRSQLSRLWDEERGIFANRRTDTGELSPRFSPTNLYPLIAGVASPEQARRMMDEHFLAPDKLGGEWIMPSIERDDPAYSEQHYWRGRIWAPMNYLVYLG
ncbi:MAG TPA: trehalase family glycosidase, partial [Abditibacteriaceae bacterium]